jgi:hypothetical protein
MLPVSTPERAQVLESARMREQEPEQAPEPELEPEREPSERVPSEAHPQRPWS